MHLSVDPSYNFGLAELMFSNSTGHWWDGAEKNLEFWQKPYKYFEAAFCNYLQQVAVGYEKQRLLKAALGLDSNRIFGIQTKIMQKTCCGTVVGHFASNHHKTPQFSMKDR